MWARGRIDGHEYWAKHSGGPGFGIDSGRISMLAIRDQKGRWVVNYDRGWDRKPTKETRAIYEKLLEMYN